MVIRVIRVMKGIMGFIGSHIGVDGIYLIYRESECV